MNFKRIFIVVGLFILIILVSIQYASPSIDKYVANHAEHLSWVPLSYLLKEAATGDLIFLSGPTFTEKSIRWATQSYYSHIALVIRTIDTNVGESCAFLWETDVGQSYREGPRVIRLKDKLERWQGFKYGAWKRYISPLGQKPDVQLLLDIGKPYLSYKMDRNLFGWFLSNRPNSYLYDLFKEKNTVYCSELIAATLQKAKIVDLGGKDPAWYTPEHFFADGVRVLNGCYSTPLYFSFS